MELSHYVASLNQVGQLGTILVLLAITYLGEKFKGKQFLLTFMLLEILSAATTATLFYFSQQELISFDQQIAYQSALPLLHVLSWACLAGFGLSWISDNPSFQSIGSLFFSFKGRIDRRVFWTVFIVHFCIGFWFSAACLDLLMFESKPSQAVGFMALAFFEPIYAWSLLSVYAKRWHDLGKSGWMTLIILIPLIGPIWFWVCVGFAKGIEGRKSNQININEQFRKAVSSPN